MPTPARQAVQSARRVLICDQLAPEALEVFAQHGIEAGSAVGLPEERLLEAAAGAAALVVRSGTRVNRRLIEAAPQLEVIGRAGVGVDNVDLDAATEHGVVVMNAPGGNTTTTAELAIALLCALARHVPRADRAVRELADEGVVAIIGPLLRGECEAAAAAAEDRGVPLLALTARPEISAR